MQDLDDWLIQSEESKTEYEKAMNEFEKAMEAYPKEDDKEEKKLPKKEQTKYTQRLNKILSVVRKTEGKHKSMLFVANKNRNIYYNKTVFI